MYLKVATEVHINWLSGWPHLMLSMGQHFCSLLLSVREWLLLYSRLGRGLLIIAGQILCMESNQYVQSKHTNVEPKSCNYIIESKCLQDLSNSYNSKVRNFW